MNDGEVRISKILADRGLCSRREADRYIEQGLVTVDGQVVSTLGAKARPDQRIELVAAARKQQESRITVIIHKTIGLVSHRDDDGHYPPAVSLVTPDRLWRHPSTQAACAGLPTPLRLHGLAPAGRLDIDSTGMLVMTQDGRVARLLIADDSPIEKEYLVRVTGKLAPDGLAMLRHGLSLDGQALRPAKVSWQNESQLRFVLREGKKRQIRRMCELVGLQVVGLKRIRIGRIALGALPLGQWRPLAPWERF
jgi:23S rRNA pseudouridine2604 synthase